MTDRPIIMSASMVRALLDGRKSQTRRLAWRDSSKNKTGIFAPTIWQKVKVGDRLWVRETWGVDQRGDATPKGNPYDPQILYRENDPEPEPANRQWEPFRWRPSIHMPRWASRITLVVTETRVGRLQEITEDGAKAEGVEPFLSGGPLQTTTEPGFEYRVGFARLWEALHGKGSWAANPEVVALTFTVHQCNIDEMEAAA